MKRITLFLLFLLFTVVSVKAQDHLTLHNGNIVKGQVLESNQSFIRFIYERETSVNLLVK